MRRLPSPLFAYPDQGIPPLEVAVRAIAIGRKVINGAADEYGGTTVAHRYELVLPSS